MGPLAALRQGDDTGRGRGSGTAKRCRRGFDEIAMGLTASAVDVSFVEKRTDRFLGWLLAIPRQEVMRDACRAIRAATGHAAPLEIAQDFILRVAVWRVRGVGGVGHPRGGCREGR